MQDLGVGKEDTKSDSHKKKKVITMKEKLDFIKTKNLFYQKISRE